MTAEQAIFCCSLSGALLSQGLTGPVLPPVPTFARTPGDRQSTKSLLSSMGTLYCLVAASSLLARLTLGDR